MIERWRSALEHHTIFPKPLALTVLSVTLIGSTAVCVLAAIAAFFTTWAPVSAGVAFLLVAPLPAGIWFIGPALIEWEDRRRQRPWTRT